MSREKPIKLYCYVDETGQDTLGKFFIVVTIVLDDKRLIFERFLEQCERDSGKGIKKWTHTPDKTKIVYIKQITGVPKFLVSSIYFKRFGLGYDYDHRTFVTIREALKNYATEYLVTNFHVTILVDALNFEQQKRLKKACTQTGMNTTIRGIRDQSSAITRFADAIAGLVRDSQDDRSAIHLTVKRKIKRGIFRELK